jgi:hypothetical protein
MATTDFLIYISAGHFQMSDKTRKSPQSAAPVAKDRRTDPRYKFSAASVVVEKISGAQVESSVNDLGSRGCFLNTGNPFPLGTIVAVRIMKEGKSFEAEARVVFSSEGKGMGLFFTTVDPAQHEILQEWLASSLETSWLASTRRQSQRILVRLPVHVAGKNSFGTTFDEETYTQAVSAHGALVLLSASVKKGQRLTLSNERTNASLECIVAHIGSVQENRVQVGMSFILPNPGFWNVTFPPEGWSIRHPDAKSAKSKSSVVEK